MKAVIMAGGEGTRLRPLTSNAPKPLLPLVNRPMMEHVVDLLKRHGIDDIVVTVAFMANSIREYFGDGSDFGVTMTYATEETPLGTAGSVRNAKDHLTERFVVISGDVLTDVDISAIVATHDEKSAMATIGLAHVDNPLEFGIVITRDDGSIERFLEKPTWGQVFSDTINTGIFVLEPEIFDYIEEGRPVDFSGEVFPALLADGRPLYGAVTEGYWEDVGTIDSYVRAHKDILDGRVRVEIPGFEVRPGVWLGENADVHTEATIVGPAVIGENCRVEADAVIGEYTVLGANVRIRQDAFLERTVVNDHAYLGEAVRLRGTVVGRSCDLRKGVRTEEGVVLGDECFVGDEASIGAEVKIYPFKTIEAGAVVNESIVWESRGARSLFGRNGVNGLANVDITPEFAVRVAMAYGGLLKQGSTVITSRDSSRSARMLKRAMMAGLNAVGVNVEDLEVASVPVTRFVMRRPTARGGLTVRLDRNDPQSLLIRFFDDEGLDITEEVQRKVERLYDRQDFRRVFPGEIGDIGYAPRALEHYSTALEATVDVDRIRAARFKVVIDYAYGSASFAMPNVLAKLGLEVLAVNPFISTAGVLSDHLDDHALRVGDLVRTSGSQLGGVIDPDGEQLRLIDDEGHVLTPTETLLALLTLLPGALHGDRVALPVNTTSTAKRILDQHGIGVVWTKMSSAALMDAATEPGVGFAGNQSGNFILPGFMPGFDAAATLVKVLDLLSFHDLKLSEVVEKLPRVHLVHESVVTPWDQKGLVMRSLMEQSKDRETVLVDGVKVVHDGGWALALPDPEEPVTHVWAEGSSPDAARRLAEEYARRIRQMVR
ncbi:MAG: sugar phosphate nucleotidyltransferase [Acidimicrobiales bacterium]|jgi:mannose-1-phosphate guanylyltransferase/phosphomannomutase|nr:sugar phosphate nucleotidyltransferase [Acidimicrobiales bacterium]